MEICDKTHNCINQMQFFGGSQMSLSDKERKVIRCLTQDSDRPRKQIASQVGISEADLSRTISNLTDRRIIQRFTVELDYKEIGFPDIGIFIFSIKDKNLSHIVVEKLQLIKEIIEIHEIFSHDYDFIVKIMGSDNKGIRNTCRYISNIEEVDSSHVPFTLIIADTHKFSLGIEV